MTITPTKKKSTPDHKLLRTLILELLPVLRTRAKREEVAQKKSLLAALLFEAHRSQAYLRWGSYRSLGSWATEQKVNPRHFQKFLTAGQRLEEYMPERYLELMAAVTGGTAVPQLPQVSKLAALQRRLTDGEVPGHVQALLGSRRAKTAIIQMGIQGAEYGDAEGEDIKLLRAIDEACERAEQLGQLLQEAHARGRKDEAGAVLAARLAKLEEVAARVVELSTSLRLKQRRARR